MHPGKRRSGVSSIVYQKHKNGSTYAYRSESFRSPKTGRPTSRREYLGRVDPLTGEIVPKRPRRPARAAEAPDAGAPGDGPVRDARIAELEAENARLHAALATAVGVLGDLGAMLGGALDGEEEEG